MTNAQDQPIVIDSETARRMALNAEFNPRQTIMNEATQTLNPIDGKPYVGAGYISNSFTNNYFEYILHEGGINVDFLGKFETLVKPQTTEFLDYQLALARMDVRDGKMHPTDYQATKRRTECLAQKMNKAGISLGIITGADGLDTALSQIENEARLAEKQALYLMSLGLDILKENSKNKDYITEKKRNNKYESKIIHAERN